MKIFFGHVSFKKGLVQLELKRISNFNKIQSQEKTNALVVLSLCKS